ncbi:Protein RIC1-like protein, partial [Ophiophagus hannah]
MNSMGPGDEGSIGSATDLTETSSIVDGDWTMVDEKAGCLDWCMVAGLILQESSVINQGFSLVQSSEVAREMLQNIKTGLQAGERWVSTDW